MNHRPQANLITAVPSCSARTVHRPRSMQGGIRTARRSRLRRSVRGRDDGEFTTLSDDERLDVCAAAAEAFGPERTYWHVGAASTHQPHADRGRPRPRARRLAALTPYYFPATESAVLDYYETVVRRAGDLPVYAYLFAVRTTTEVSPEPPRARCRHRHRRGEDQRGVARRG